MTRTPKVLPALVATGLAVGGLVGLSGCGVVGRAATDAPAAGSAATEVDLGGEAAALTAVGFETGLGADPPPTVAPTSVAPGGEPKARRPGPARRLLRKNTMHGEVTVLTRQGVKTVAAQRGAVTAVTPTSVTVKSTDGFTATWTFADKLVVRQDRRPAERAAVVVGAQVGVAGPKTGAARTARLVGVG
jgi:hypothetical protein